MNSIINLAAVPAVFDRELWSEVPFGFWILVFFVFGCIVGSFLNVCIHRMPLDQSLISPPFALSPLPIQHPLVPQRAAGDLALAEGAMCELPRLRSRRATLGLSC
jgi:hypothetical protein